MQKNKSLFKNLLLIDTVEYGLQILTVNGSDYKSKPAGKTPASGKFYFILYILSEPTVILKIPNESILATYFETLMSL